MQVSIQAFGTLAAISGLLIGVFFHYHKESYACWATFSTILFLGLAFCLYWQNSINQKQNKELPPKTEAKSNDKVIKFPDHKFTETPEKVMISFASITAGYKSERLITEKVTPVMVPGVKLFAYIENNVLYADTEFYGGQGHTISISKNTLSGLPPKWDYNSTNKALEIVNENVVPIYQLIYKTPNHICINGVFPSASGLILADEDGMHINPKLPIPLKIKRIFKYPSYQHPGVYEEENR